MASHTHATSTEEELQIPARVWASVLLIPWVILMHAAYAGVSMEGMPTSSWQHSWAIFGFLLSMPGAFLILLRARRPEFALLLSTVMTIAFPLSPLQCQILAAAVIARRPRARTWAIPLMLATTLFAEGKDLLRGTHHPDASLWFATQTENPNPSLTVAIATAVLVAGAGVAIAITAGYMMRERASRAHAEGNLQRERTRATKLQSEIDARTFSEAVAREAHDTLAHSLSVLALQSVTLARQALTLAQHVKKADVHEFASLQPTLAEEAEAISEQASQLRAMSAGALDDAHTVIEMLRNPEVTLDNLSQGSDEAALTRESLGELIEQARSSGLGIESWIDVSDLTQLSPVISTLAYRVIQEGLSNAIRHASEPRVQLEVNAQEGRGVFISVINPVATGGAAAHPSTPTGVLPEESEHTGHGLAEIEERIRSCSGRCTWGEEDGKFALHVHLPWVRA